MKTDLARLFVRIWLILSEVPGWPDAPTGLRLRRVAPIVIAVTAMAGLLGWKFGWREPGQQQVRAAYAPVIAFEEEVAQLRLVCSDQEASEVAERAEAAAGLLLTSAEEVPAFLRHLRERMRALGWEAEFQAYGAPVVELAAGAAVELASARGRLVPVTGDPAPFSTLLGVFDQIPGGTKRIDLTRLGIRADENGRLEVEINLHIACRPSDEKAS